MTFLATRDRNRELSDNCGSSLDRWRICHGQMNTAPVMGLVHAIAATAFCLGVFALLAAVVMAWGITQ